MSIEHWVPHKHLINKQPNSQTQHKSWICLHNFFCFPPATSFLCLLLSVVSTLIAPHSQFPFYSFNSHLFFSCFFILLFKSFYLKFVVCDNFQLIFLSSFFSTLSLSPMYSMFGFYVPSSPFHLAFVSTVFFFFIIVSVLFRFWLDDLTEYKN